MKEINTISAEVYRERRKHLSCMVHSDLMQLLRQVARQQRWSLSRTTDEILLRGFGRLVPYQRRSKAEGQQCWQEGVGSADWEILTWLFIFGEGQRMKYWEKFG